MHESMLLDPCATYLARYRCMYSLYIIKVILCTEVARPWHHRLELIKLLLELPKNISYLHDSYTTLDLQVINNCTIYAVRITVGESLNFQSKFAHFSRYNLLIAAM